MPQFSHGDQMFVDEKGAGSRFIRTGLFYGVGCTQIAAPSKELAPAMSMVKFDWTTLMLPLSGSGTALHGGTAGKLAGSRRLT